MPRSQREALAPVLLLALVAHAAAAITCPTSGSATSCYQGVVGAPPAVQLYLYSIFQWTTLPHVYYESVVSTDGQGNYLGYHYEPFQAPSMLEGSGYTWNPPVTSLPSLAGAVAPTPTASNTGVCTNVTVTCEQLFNYISLSAVDGARNAVPPQADWYGYLCPSGTKISIFMGLPSTQPCNDLVTLGTGEQANGNSLAKAMLATLNPMLCTTTNCNAPATAAPIQNTTFSCPTTASATSCYTGLVGATSVTLQNFLAKQYSDLLGPFLSRHYGYALPAMTKQQIAGAVTPVTLGSGAGSASGAGGVCVSATIPCSQIFNYVLSMQLYDTDAFVVSWSQMCPHGSSLTAYLGGKLPMCGDAATGISTSGGMYYGLPAVTCGTTNCNAPPPPAAVVAPPPLLSLSTTLSGYTVVTFDLTAQGAFKAAVATTLSLSVSAINITSTSNATAAAAGRHLLAASGVVVQYTVATTQSAASVSSALTTGSTFSNALSASFAAVSRPVPVATGVTALSASAAPATSAAMTLLLAALVAAMLLA